VCAVYVRIVKVSCYHWLFFIYQMKNTVIKHLEGTSTKLVFQVLTSSLHNSVIRVHKRFAFHYKIPHKRKKTMTESYWVKYSLCVCVYTHLNPNGFGLTVICHINFALSFSLCLRLCVYGSEPIQ